MKNYIKGKIKLFREIIFGRIGMQNDFVGYETLIDYIEKNKLHELEGDFLEIGAFMGGGSAKLARYAKRYGKKLIIIDLFDPDFDPTPNNRGERMNWIYRKILGKKKLKDIFNKNTRNERNIVVHNKDSKKVRLPKDTKLCFSFIDGNHDPDYVKNDFDVAQDKTVPGGVIAYHDYGGDLPQTTKAIQSLIDENVEKIIKTEIVPEKTIIFITLR